ncbi:hypothetical protein [Nonomuraea sp. NPDC049709]|uniref:hypothetical protein n=1 Tax=Nonomuraea sp. NPDC049709 TaxID=3154736 RepID=UPI0034261B91
MGKANDTGVMTLRDLGFDELAERTYRALLQKPEHDLTALEAHVGAVEDDLRNALAHLVDLGVARTHPAAPSGVVAVDPTASLRQLIEHKEDELLRKYRKVAGLRTELGALSVLDARGMAGLRGGGPGVEWIDGMRDVRERLHELSSLTRASMYCVLHGRPRPEVCQALDLRLRRGIELRLVHERSVLDDERNRTYLHRLMAEGARIRVSDRRLDPLIVMDEQVAVVPIDPENHGQGALVVRQVGLLTGFLRLFDRLWDEARELSPDLQDISREPGLTDDDRRLLDLLASGNTDEVAARRLGVSVRHLRRRIARLTARLEASSRFEAGVAAVRRGWL